MCQALLNARVHADRLFRLQHRIVRKRQIRPSGGTDARPEGTVQTSARRKNVRRGKLGVRF